MNNGSFGQQSAGSLGSQPSNGNFFANNPQPPSAAGGGVRDSTNEFQQPRGAFGAPPPPPGGNSPSPLPSTENGAAGSSEGGITRSVTSLPNQQQQQFQQGGQQQQQPQQPRMINHAQHTGGMMNDPSANGMCTCCDPTTNCFDCLGGPGSSQYGAAGGGPDDLPPSYCDNSTCAIILLALLSFVGFVVIAATGKDFASEMVSGTATGAEVDLEVCKYLKDLSRKPSYCPSSTDFSWPTQAPVNSSAPSPVTPGLATNMSVDCTLVAAIGFFLRSPPKVCAEDYFTTGFIQAQSSNVQNYLVTFYFLTTVGLLYALVIAVRHNDNVEANKKLAPQQQMQSGLNCCGQPQAPQDPNQASTFPILFHGTPQFLSFLQFWFLGATACFFWGMSLWYPYFQVAPIWANHSEGKLGSYFVALHLKMLAGTFVLVPIVCFPFFAEVVLKPLSWCACVLPWCVFRNVGDARVQTRPPGYRKPIDIPDNDVVPFNGGENTSELPCCIQMDDFFINNCCCRKMLQSIQNSVMQSQQAAAEGGGTAGSGAQAPGVQNMEGGNGVQYTPSKELPPMHPNGGGGGAFSGQMGAGVTRSLALSEQSGDLTDDEERRRRKKEKKEKKERKEREKKERASRTSPLERQTSAGTFGATTSSANLRSSAAFSEADDEDVVNTGGVASFDYDEQQRKDKKSKKEKKSKKDKKEKKDKKSRSPEQPE